MNDTPAIQRVECKIYGSYYRLPLLSVSEDGSHGTIMIGGDQRTLPIVTQAQRHAHDSCILSDEPLVRR